MTTDELRALFEKHGDEYLEFDRVTNKRSPRKDLHAFLLLADLFPGTESIIGGADHDIVYLNFDLEELAESKITEEQIVELIRAGVRLDEEYDCLAMFV